MSMPNNGGAIKVNSGFLPQNWRMISRVAALPKGEMCSSMPGFTVFPDRLFQAHNLVFTLILFQPEGVFGKFFQSFIYDVAHSLVFPQVKPLLINECGLRSIPVIYI